MILHQGHRFLAATLALAVTTASAADDVDFEKALTEIRELQSQGKSDAVIARCEKTVKQLRESKETPVFRGYYLNKIGQIYYENGAYKNANTVFDEAGEHRLALKQEYEAKVRQTYEKFNGSKIDTVASYAFAAGNYGSAIVDRASLMIDVSRLNEALDEPLAAQKNYDHCRTSLPDAAHNLKMCLDYFAYLEKAGGSWKTLVEKWRPHFQRYSDEANRLTASVENNCGALCESIGQFKDARANYLLCLDIARKNRDASIEVAALNNLGLLAYRLRDYNEAIERFREVQQRNQSGSLDLAKTNINLSLTYHAKGDLRQAREAMENAGAVLEKFPYQRNLQAVRLHNLGGLLCSERNYVASERCYRDSLAILTDLFGETHPDTAAARIELARLYCCRGDIALAAAEMDTARHSLREHIHRVLSFQSRAHQLEFFRNKNEHWFHGALTVGLQAKDNDKIAAASAEWLFNGNAVSMPAAASRSLLARSSKNNEIAERLYEELKELRSQMVASVQIGQKSANEAALLDREEKLLVKLAQATGSPALEKWTTLEDVRAHLGDAVLIEIARFAVADFTTKAPDWNSRSENYVAWVIPPRGKGNVKIIDLGDAKIIDALVRAFHEGMEAFVEPLRKGKATGDDQREMVKQPLDALSKRVLAPLRSCIDAYEHWVIAPDGELWRVPWVALPYEGDYLVQKKTVSYLVSGRHVVPQQFHVKLNAPAVFAGVDYGGDGLFIRLPYSEREGNEIKPLLDKYMSRITGRNLQSELITGDAATEERFYQMQRPGALVLSTHAFFLDDDGDNSEMLSRCGIAFSGANHYAKNRSNGVLFGIELLDRVDLRGSDLVLLSACQTAKGEVHNGEGAKSLQYAFQLAGARSVVGTLWEVPDKTTAILTIDFFKNLAAGHDKATALCKAQKDMLNYLRNLEQDDHPLFWAGLALTGLWKPVAE